MDTKKSIQGEWSSDFGFILAATGSAVGLGNIWKFPYIAGENGGGAFVIVYLACVLLIGVPIMMAEIMMGRRSRQNPIDALTSLTEEAGADKRWRYLGWIFNLVLLQRYCGLGLGVCAKKYHRQFFRCQPCRY
jgi:neurotransmitter:Na+ symporter, NSS family